MASQHVMTGLQHSQSGPTLSFQAILQGDHQVLLTTFSVTRNEWITLETSKDMILGTMWSYETAYRRQVWTAYAEHEGIVCTHRKAQTIRANKWIAFHFQIRKPEDIQIFHASA